MDDRQTDERLRAALAQDIDSPLVQLACDLRDERDEARAEIAAAESALADALGPLADALRRAREWNAGNRRRGQVYVVDGIRVLRDIIEAADTTAARCKALGGGL